MAVKSNANVPSQNVSPDTASASVMGTYVAWTVSAQTVTIWSRERRSSSRVRRKDASVASPGV